MISPNNYHTRIPQLREAYSNIKKFLEEFLPKAGYHCQIEIKDKDDIKIRILITLPKPVLGTMKEIRERIRREIPTLNAEIYNDKIRIKINSPNLDTYKNLVLLCVA